MPRRIARALTTGAAALGLLVGAGGVAAAGAPAATAATPLSCSGVVQINAFAFTPAQVLAGQSSTASLTARNCTAKSQTVNEMWYGRFSNASTGIPAGCPVLDPFIRSVSIAAHAKTTTATTYTVNSGCTATQLAVTVTISAQDGTVLAQRTANLRIT